MKIIFGILFFFLSFSSIAQIEGGTDSELEELDRFSEAAEVDVEVDPEEDFDFD